MSTSGNAARLIDRLLELCRSCVLETDNESRAETDLAWRRGHNSALRTVEDLIKRVMHEQRIEVGLDELEEVTR